jgi:hypothetical protein
VLLGGHLPGEEGPNNNIYNSINEKEKGSNKIKTFLFLFSLVAMRRGRGIGEKNAQLQYTNYFVKKKKKKCIISPQKNQQPTLINMILLKKKKIVIYLFASITLSYKNQPLHI